MGGISCQPLGLCKGTVKESKHSVHQRNAAMMAKSPEWLVHIRLRKENVSSFPADSTCANPKGFRAVTASQWPNRNERYRTNICMICITLKCIIQHMPYNTYKMSKHTICMTQSKKNNCMIKIKYLSPTNPIFVPTDEELVSVRPSVHPRNLVCWCILTTFRNDKILVIVWVRIFLLLVQIWLGESGIIWGLQAF